MFRTAAIVLNWKSFESVRRCVESITKSLKEGDRVVIVDNDSADGSGARLQSHFPQHVHLSSGGNLGFAGGYNKGLQWALNNQFEAMWIVAADTEVEPDALAEMQKVHRSEAKIGFVGSLIDYNNLDHIYFWKAVVDETGTVKHPFETKSFSNISHISGQSSGDTDYVNATSLFLTTEVLQDVGLMTEDYFLYFEDVDWGLRARRKGYSHRVAYKSRVHHLKPMLQPNLLAEFYCRRNQFYFLEKNGFPADLTAYLKKIHFRERKVRIKAWLGVNSKENHRLCHLLKHVRESLSAHRMGREDLWWL